jgi:predicted NAD/FAD-binding protein
VIGGGVAGLSAAWMLSRAHDVTLFERNAYIGGHSNTLDVDTPDGPAAVDTGFVVYNRRNYPLLTRMFEHLGVAVQDTDMTFSASIDDGRIEYAGSGLNTLFAQRRNLVQPAYWGMLRDILRFNRDAKRRLEAGASGPETLGEFLEQHGYGRRLRDHYLLPMAAAIWSCPPQTMREFPAHSFLSFFRNHGLLDLANRPQWRTVTGGSREYVHRILAELPGHTHASRPATCVCRSETGAVVHTRGGPPEHFDEVILACHADEALRLIDRPSRAEGRILGAFSYQENRTLLHSDPQLMPRARRVWSSWNYLAHSLRGRTDRVSVTYWMNRLQRLGASQPLLVSLNPLREPRADRVLAELSYHHPVFDTAAIKAQQELSTLQGTERLWFCGSYAGFGFHEDALRSAVGVCAGLGVRPPWQDASATAPATAPSALRPELAPA